MAAPPRAAAPPPAAAPPVPEPAASSAPEDAGAEDLSPAEAVARRERERAMAEALALEEGFDDEDVAAPPSLAHQETQAWGSAGTQDEDSEDEPISAMGGAGKETQAWGSTQDDGDDSE